MPLMPKDPAPEFELASTHGLQRLRDYRGRWVALYFYPKDDTPGCTAEACDFRDLLPGLEAVVLGVSADDLVSHQQFAHKHQLPFPLLSDTDHRVAEAYGAWGEKQSYGKAYQGLIRSTFIIDPEGRVAEALRNVKADGHAERVAARLRQLQTA